MSGLTKVLVAVFVAVQFALPALLLPVRWSGEGSMPTVELPFRWQMFSAVDPGGYTGAAADGSERDLSLDDLPRITRAIAYSDDVPLMLCEQNPDLMSVARSGVEDG
ncbi:hypothetical protein NGF75_11365 [Dietzia kunjamensis]|uniref:hypothetical protein n=1 Tax=Dietzia kunjamensis TaxID=322509 RepID=UPI002DB76832|nr:hypothetical protein [Dietzia kunjamensis]MEB8326578.1 hypothetical protein [Dietzia kunjamensis]